jgi:very-short-patch-repair endonuclease
VPCTSPSRTIIDVAGTSREYSLRGTVEQAAVLGVLDVVEFEEFLTASPRRRGSPLLRAILDDWRRYPRRLRLRSRMEAKLLPLLTRWRIPIPRVNEYLHVSGERFELDFLWPEARLVVETDGRKYHGNPFAQARDDHRNRVLRAAGYEVRRLSWQDLTTRPQTTLNHLTNLLTRTPGSAVP